jgi:glucosamine--fructose-6-phosphate aminotransferase (isomerizing)
MERGLISRDDATRIITELHEIPAKIEKVLEKSEDFEKIAKLFMNATNFLYLGRGYLSLLP